MSGGEMMAPLETKRLRLRCLEPRDAEATARLMTPMVSGWVASWKYPFSEDMAASRIEASRKAMAQKRMAAWAVELDGQLIGWMTVKRDDADARRAGLGYWLGEPYHGKGYMSEIAPVALRAAFEFLEVDVIEAAAQIGNAASFKIMAACGMKPTKQGMFYAPAREREELCQWYEIERPLA